MNEPMTRTLAEAAAAAAAATTGPGIAACAERLAEAGAPADVVAQLRQVAGGVAETQRQAAELLQGMVA